MRLFILGSLVTILVFVASSVICLRSGWVEVRADANTSTLEASLMRSAVHASVKREAPETANPVAPTDENLIAGGKMYLNECAGCHGTPGKVRKWASPLNPDAPQLPVAGTEYSEAQIFWIAKHGIRRTGMFANGVWESDQKLWTITGYIYRMKSLPPQVAAEIDKAVSSN
jgi:mono/diheme cytochrome c family protein